MSDEFRTHFDWLRAHLNYEGEGCLTWPFGMDDKGYGQVKAFDRIRKAHRVMCEMVNGIPPSSKHQASHNCGKGHLGCVHPKHLEWKTNSENQLDRRKHGTHLGSKVGAHSADQRADSRDPRSEWRSIQGEDCREIWRQTRLCRVLA